MPESSTSSAAGSPAQESHFLDFLTAMFFLLAPIAVLMFLAVRTRSTPQDAYTRAVGQAMQPSASAVSHSLLPVRFGEEITVVTWTRHGSVPVFKDKDKEEERKKRDTWVTLAPSLKKFCQGYVKSEGANAAKLTRRLEQRLGLPPNSGYDTFVELTVKPQSISDLFRPCNDPSPASNSCSPAIVSACNDKNARPEDCLPRRPHEIDDDITAIADAGKRLGIRNRYWFLNNYFGSFAQQKQFPWTSLGYTFDWALEPGGEHFEQFGESEFVIPAGAPMQFVSATDTVAYCASQ
jgi:hypothetical protein